MMMKTKPSRQHVLEEEARIALRSTLKREPTAVEMRHLRLGESALGDNELLRLRTENALQTLRELLRSKRELLAKLRQNRKEIRKQAAKARRLRSRPQQAKS